MTIRGVALHVLTALALILTVPALAVAQSDGRGGRQTKKIDRALEEAVTKNGASQRVIIRTRDVSRRAIRQALETHGDVVFGEHDRRSLITAEVHGDDVAALAASDAVLSLSIDAIVTPAGAKRAKTDHQTGRNADRRTAHEVRRPARDVADRRSERHVRKPEREAGNRGWERRRKPARDERDHHRTDGRQTTGQRTTSGRPRQEGRLIHDTLGLDRHAPTGAGVVIAVIDSGIEPLADFGPRLVASLDCRRPEGCLPTRHRDEYGHGTHIAGLMAGGMAGVAPDALLISLKVLDGDGQGFTSDVIKALDWVTANRARYGIQVVNLSLGHPIYEPAATDPLVIAVQETVQAGAKVLVAAGNYGMNEKSREVGYAGITSPGNAPSAITIGATGIDRTAGRDDDRVADYSSRGPTWFDGFLKPDVVAPGDSLYAFLPAGSKLKAEYRRLGGSEGDDDYEDNFVPLSGTSMATAVATGVVATLLQASPLSPNLVKAILQYTAIPVYDGKGHLYDPLTQGSGSINAGGALAVIDSIDPSVPAPEYWLTGWQSTDAFGQTTIAGKPYTWTQSIFWGDNIVWGSGLVASSQWAWGDNIVWGSSHTFLDNIVWGSDWLDNIVWGSLFGGDNIVWGSNVFLDNIVWGSSFGFDNIVWGSSWLDNIVWGSSWGDNIVWGSSFAWGDNIVWGSNLLSITIDGNVVYSEDWFDNIVWGSNWFDNIVWGSDWFDNIVWSSDWFDNIVWGSDRYDGGGDDDDDDDEHDDENRASSWDDNIVWGSDVVTGMGR